MEKVSKKLQALVESEAPEKEVDLNVMLRRGLDDERVAELVGELADLAADRQSVELLPSSGIVLMRGTLGAVERLTRNPAVEWVDKDTEAPVEELLDS